MLRKYIIQDYTSKKFYILSIGKYIFRADKLPEYTKKSIGEHPEGSKHEFRRGERPFEIWDGKKNVKNRDFTYDKTKHFLLGEEIFVWNHEVGKYFRVKIVGILDAEVFKKMKTLIEVEG
jgi:hypothetical protein